MSPRCARVFEDFVFENFRGNRHVQSALAGMIERERIPQTMLFAGLEGLGKATLARRFAARLLDSPDKIERDDLSLPENSSLIGAREKLPSDKRNDDPLVFSSHPDFLTFPPDGPLRQIGIPQMRLLKERAQFKPLKGSRRVFLIDQADRAGEQAANSLLKILEEPPDHLILIMTAENVYDLLPTIRSRSVILNFSPLTNDDMEAFARDRQLDHAERRIALSGGSPGVAASLDIEVFQKRRASMLALLKTGAGAATYGSWLPISEALGRSKNERLELYLRLLYDLLRDLTVLREGGSAIRNFDLRADLSALAQRISRPWIVNAVKGLDEIASLLRRNIQKSIALDGLLMRMRSPL
ncbi:MAG TPA: DNA polymerase III subunit delta' [Bryobacteraceae bacterium]|nr:DNA polymerase III subunit delta' [Bryobacteraceae bacterium]